MRITFLYNANFFFFVSSLGIRKIGQKTKLTQKLTPFVLGKGIKAFTTGKKRAKRRGLSHERRDSFSLSARVIRSRVRLRLVSHISLGEHETVKKRNQSV